MQKLMRRRRIATPQNPATVQSTASNFTNHLSKTNKTAGEVRTNS